MIYNTPYLQDVALKMAEICNAAYRIREKVAATSGVAYDQDDARHLGFSGIQTETIAVAHWIRTLAGLRHGVMFTYGDGWEPKYAEILAVKLPTEQAEHRMLRYLRHALVLGVHFKIENMFSNLLKELGVTLKKHGFYNISDAILEATNLPKVGLEKDALTVLANIRNSFHGNGIHNQNDKSCTFNGTLFEFKKGQPVTCASWDDIVVIVNENLTVLEKIVLSPTIASIKTPIPDAFTTLMPNPSPF